MRAGQAAWESVCGGVRVHLCWGAGPYGHGGSRRPAPAPRPGLRGGRPWPPPRVWGLGLAALPCSPSSSWGLGSATRGLPLPEAPWASPLDLCPCLSPGVPPVPTVGLCDPAHPPGPSPHPRHLCGPPAAHRAAPPEAELPEAPQARLTVSAPQIRQGWRGGWMDE